MSLYVVSASLATFCTLVLTILVLRDHTDRKALLFGLCNLSIIIWNLSDLFIALVPNQPITLWVYRVSNVGGIALPALLVRFVHCLTGSGLESGGSYRKWRIGLLRILDAAVLIAAPLCLTPFIVKDLGYNPFSEIRGPAYALLAGTYLYGLTLAFVDLTQGLLRRKLASNDRQQVGYFLAALTVGAAGIYLYLTGNLKLAPVYFTLEVAYVVIIAYIVKQHKFLNIKSFSYRYLALIPCSLLLLVFIAPLNLRVSSSIVAATFCFALAYFALLADKGTNANKYFAFLNISLGVWNIGELLVLFPQNAASLLFYRLTYMGGSFIVPSFLNFMYNLFGYQAHPKVKRYIKTYSLLSIFFAVLSFTPLLIKDVSYVPGGETAIVEKPGIAFPFFAVFFLAGLIYSLKPLYSTYRESKGLKRNQLRYVIAAVAIGTTAVAVYFGTFIFKNIPPIYYVIEMGVMGTFAIAILRYRLLDSNIFFKNVMVYLTSSLVCASPFLLAALYAVYHGKIVQLLVISLLAYPYVFKVIHEKLESIADTLLFPRFAYYERLYAIEKNLDSALTSGQVAEGMVKPIVEHMKLIGGCLLLYDKFEDAFVARSKVGLPEIISRQMPTALNLIAGNPLIPDLEKAKRPIVLEELAEKNDVESRAVKEAMTDIEAALCMPLFIKGQLKGVLGLGFKESNDMFNQEDLDALDYLVHEAEKRLMNILFMEERVLFSSGLAHDMRAPMMKAGRLWEALNRLRESTGGLLNEVQQKALEVIYRDAVQLRNLIMTFSEVGGQLVQFLSTGRMLGNFDYRGVVLHNFNLCKPEAEAKGLELKMICPDVLPVVHGNENEISRVLNNIVENALKFTEKGSVAIEVVIDEKKVLTKVIDTGPGIARKDQEQILQPGQQAETAQKKQGLGLGLAIVKGLVQNNGGEFWFESEPGAGSTFYFTVPQAAEDHQGIKAV